MFFFFFFFLRKLEIINIVFRVYNDLDIVGFVNYSHSQYCNVKQIAYSFIFNDIIIFTALYIILT